MTKQDAYKSVPGEFVTDLLNQAFELFQSYRAEFEHNEGEAWSKAVADVVEGVESYQWQEGSAPGALVMAYPDGALYRVKGVFAMAELSVPKNGGGSMYVPVSSMGKTYLLEDRFEERKAELERKVAEAEAREAK